MLHRRAFNMALENFPLLREWWGNVFMIIKVVAII
jgi:hypothetical protein